jgi:RecA-family ATPase
MTADTHNHGKHIDSSYTADYVQRAITAERLEPPHSHPMVNGENEILNSLYVAHKAGGPEAARVAWEAIRKVRPEADKLTQRKRKLIHADELKRLSPPEYLIDEYPFFDNGMNVLVGPSGGGKSFVALDFAARLVKRGDQVVYIAGEGLHGYAARWEVLKDHLQIEDKAPFQFYSEPVQIMDPDCREEFFEELGLRSVMPRLIVIDTLARCAVGMEENSNKEMGLFVAAVDAIRYKYQCGVLIVHHTGKDGNTRGASALIAACDSALMLTKADGLIKLSNRFDDGGKNKHDLEREPFFVQLIPKQVGEFSSAVIYEADQVIRSPREAGYLTQSQRSVLEVLEAFDKPIVIKQVIEACGLSQPTAYRVLKDLAYSGYITLNKKSKTYEITDQGKTAFYSG